MLGLISSARAMLESTFGFVDISRGAVRRFQRGLDNDGQKGVVDEIGALAFHDAYAERFFPGTSVLHTRARYLFFVPWVYLGMADDGVKLSRFRHECTRRLQKVKARLLDSGERAGVIGRTIDHAPAQPADFSYWNALFRYGLASPYASRSSIERRWDPSLVVGTRDRRPRRGRGEEMSLEPILAFDVPKAPSDFLRDDSTLTFRLTPEEANALIDGFGGGEPSLLSKAAQKIRKGAGRPNQARPWDEPILREAANELGWSPILARARRAAFLTAVVRAAYGFVVARRRQEDEDDEASRDAVDAYRDELTRCLDERWVEEGAAYELVPADGVDAHPSVNALFLHVRDRAKTIKRSGDLVRALADDATHDRLALAERARKGKRARLHPTTGAARRVTFTRSTVTIAPLHFRWEIARQYLRDVHEGLRT